ncbi:MULTISPECIES: hypothetical protein [unclassified Wolbachia]|uniref:hypothetical protein n=1 Tax=unclassified Wolbachia TaxID=2640676 RepID=UPI00222F16D4|nr:hypothetical protein [Wolbachia endosymbiont (group A) of Epistrophe grossularia]
MKIRLYLICVHENKKLSYCRFCSKTKIEEAAELYISSYPVFLESCYKTSE